LHREEDTGSDLPTTLNTSGADVQVYDLGHSVFSEPTLLSNINNKLSAQLDAQGLKMKDSVACCSLPCSDHDLSDVESDRFSDTFKNKSVSSIAKQHPKSNKKGKIRIEASSNDVQDSNTTGVQSSDIINKISCDTSRIDVYSTCSTCNDGTGEQATG